MNETVLPVYHSPISCDECSRVLWEVAVALILGHIVPPGESEPVQNRAYTRMLLMAVWR